MIAGLLTAKYDDYLFTLDIDLVYVHLTNFVGVSIANIRTKGVIRLNWISWFCVVIPNLYCILSPPLMRMWTWFLIQPPLVWTLATSRIAICYHFFW